MNRDVHPDPFAPSREPATHAETELDERWFAPTPSTRPSIRPLASVRPSATPRAATPGPRLDDALADRWFR